jgi:alpha-D-xyloside xylohydrolase
MFEEKDGTLICRLNGENISVIPWGKNGVRIVSTPMAAPVLYDWALIDQDNGLPASISIEENCATLTMGKIRVVVQKKDWPLRLELSFFNQKGNLLFRELDSGGALRLKARKFTPFSGGNFRINAFFETKAEEHLYGMGQYQQEFLDIKHCNLELAHRNSQASVPFVLSSLGYGFLWHNPSIGHVSFGENHTHWFSESSRQLDYWVTAGDTPREILSAYADATGHVPMMPEYGLGFWQCKLRYWNQEQLLGIAREYKKRNIPIDVIVCDFFHWPHLGDFRFEEEFFPDPKAMVEELDKLNIKLMVSVWPQIDVKSENYEEMRERGLLVHTERGVNIQMRFGGESVFFDATNPEAREYVWQKCKKNYYSHGIRIFWLDEAEPEYGEYDFENYRYSLGPALEVSNIYPQMYSRAFYEGMNHEKQENIINLARCAWAGSQRYGALVWSGDIHCDFATFKRQICAGLNMGICGIPWWTTDIGGFHGGDPSDPEFQELLVRWFQWGCFCPVMRLHGDRRPTNNPVYRKDGSMALFTGSDNEVWSYGTKAYEILVKYIKLRELLKPYIRNLMLDAHENGAPVIRPMFFEFPDDSESWLLKDQYMFGPDILVAPILESKAISRQVYLPAGAEWTELHSGKKHPGGKTITAEAPLEILPVYLKNNSHAEIIGSI